MSRVILVRKVPTRLFLNYLSDREYLETVSMISDCLFDYLENEALDQWIDYMYKGRSHLRRYFISAMTDYKKE